MTIVDDTLRVLDYANWCELVAGRTRLERSRDAALATLPEDELDAARALLAETGDAVRLILDERLPALPVARDGLSLIAHSRQHSTLLMARELAILLEFFRVARDLRRHLLALDEQPALQRIGAMIGDTEAFVDTLDRAVDLRGMLLDTASDRLRVLRLEIAELKEKIRRELERFAGSREVRTLLRSTHPSIRDGRYVLAVRAGARGQVRGIYHDRSHSGATAYVEPESVVDDQNRLQDLRIDERRESHRILWELTRLALDLEGELAATADAMARFDLACARARLAVELGLEEPVLGEQADLVLSGARHPLLLSMAFDGGEGSVGERRAEALSRVVPFDLRLGGDFDVMVLTGPNTGGKTVTLKAIGLLTLLPRAGHFLPTAAGASIPWYPQVFADVGDEQDLTQSLSTFSGHVKRIAAMLESADPGALILLDELGSGTDPLEGEALATALLDHLLERGLKAVVTTHLGRLKEFAGRRERAANASMEFDPDSLRPTFRLVLGIPGASNALRIAAHLGLPGAVLEAAGKLLDGKGRQSTELFDELDRARAALEQLRTEAEIDRREAASARNRSTTREDRLDRRESALLIQAEEAAEQRLRGLLEEVDEPRRRLLALGGQAAQAAGQLLEALRRALKASPLAERRRQFGRSLKRGDRVFLPGYNEVCVVRRLLRKEDRVEVDYRKMSVTVGFDEISPVEQSHLFQPPETT